MAAIRTLHTTYAQIKTAVFSYLGKPGKNVIRLDLGNHKTVRVYYVLVMFFFKFYNRKQETCVLLNIEE